MANPRGLWASRIPGCPEWVWHANACCSSWFSCVCRDYAPCATPGLGGLHLLLTEEGCQLFWAALCLLSPPRPPRFARQCWRQLRSCGDELAGSFQRGRALQHPRCARDVPGLAWSKQVVAKAPFFYRSSLLQAETLHKPQQPPALVSSPTQRCLGSAVCPKGQAGPTAPALRAPLGEHCQFPTHQSPSARWERGAWGSPGQGPRRWHRR